MRAALGLSMAAALLVGLGIWQLASHFEGASGTEAKVERGASGEAETELDADSDPSRFARPRQEDPRAILRPRLEASRLKCPRDMRLVASGTFMMGSPPDDPARGTGERSYGAVPVESFCVDYYEYPNARGKLPTVGLTWIAASAQCGERGRRLCTESEWEKACAGPAGFRYVYGNRWDAALCNTEASDGTDRPTAAAGDFRGCRSGYDVYDLAGNVAEWTSTRDGSGYVIKGGASTAPGPRSRCAARETQPEAAAHPQLGFRCCANPLGSAERG